MCRSSIQMMSPEPRVAAGVAVDLFAESPVSDVCDNQVKHKSLQSPARALKRQRQRERRRIGFPEEKVEDAILAMSAKVLEEAQCVSEGDSGHAACFEARAAEVAKEAKLVVKGTFFDVEPSQADGVCDMASFDDATRKRLFDLPPATFETTAEINEWRRNYRLFRLGYHMGARGELQHSVPSAADGRDELRVQTSVELVTASLAMCNNVCQETNTAFVRPLRWADGEDSEADDGSQHESTSSSQLSGRAAKRQRQRERRRQGKLA